MRKAAVITDAQGAASADLSRRQKRYVITMLFRLACFIAMFFVPGVWRWVLAAAAIFLPYVAVLFANQADTRLRGGMEPADPEPAPALSNERPELEAVQIIEPDADEPRHRDDAA